MNSVLEFLLDLVYDWDNVDSYEWTVPDIDSTSVDVLDIVDDYIDEVDPVMVSFSWPTFGGSGHTKGQGLMLDLYRGGVKGYQAARSLDRDAKEFVEFSLPSSRGGGGGLSNLEEGLDDFHQFIDELYRTHQRYQDLKQSRRR